MYNSSPSIGDEIQKIRPAIIVSNDEIGILRLKVVVPITAWNDNFTDISWMVKIDPDAENGLSKTSAADAFQIRSVSQKRLIKQIGVISISKMTEIAQALQVVLSIS